MTCFIENVLKFYFQFLLLAHTNYFILFKKPYYLYLLLLINPNSIGMLPLELSACGNHVWFIVQIFLSLFISFFNSLFLLYIDAILNKFIVIIFLLN